MNAVRESPWGYLSPFNGEDFLWYHFPELMKSVLGIGLIFFIFGPAVFGSLLMNHGMETNHSGCLAADMTGSGSCLQSNILPSSMVNVFIMPLLLLIFTVLAFLGYASRKPKVSERLIAYRRAIDLSLNSSRSNMMKYLSFHENSPSFD